MNRSEQLCLQWNEFQNNASSIFRELRNEPESSDVTLASEDNQHIEVHKLILMASSPVFREMFKHSKQKHPIIFLRGIKSTDLVSLVDFMYYGEVNINQDHLGHFLNLAKEIQIKGLDSQDIAEDLVPTKPFLSPIQKRKDIKPRSKHVKKETTEYESTLQLDKTNTIETNQSRSINIFQDEAQVVKLRKEINTMIEKNEMGYMCKVCGVSMIKRHHIGNHIEAKHMEVEHPCLLCLNGTKYGSRKSLAQHMSFKHK